jgi:hypothetical protein
MRTKKVKTDRFGSSLSVGDQVSFIRPYTHTIADGTILELGKTGAYIAYSESHPAGYKHAGNNVGDCVSRKYTDIFKRPSIDAITIPKYRYNELLEESDKFRALEQHGVDNWIGYGEAMEELSDEE